MSRSIHSSVVTALSQTNIEPFYAVNFNFDTPVYYWTGMGSLNSADNSNNKTYVGAGALLKIDGLEETSEVKATNVRITLNGVPSSLMSLALSTTYHGRTAEIFFGVKGNSNLTSVFVGYMDTMDIDDNPEGGTISMTLESKLVDLDRARPFRYTRESYRNLQANDTFLNFVVKLQDVKSTFGVDVED